MKKALLPEGLSIYGKKEYGGMNILFVSLVDFDSLAERNIYTDLLRQFVKNGHDVTAVSPRERKTNKKQRILKRRIRS